MPAFAGMTAEGLVSPPTGKMLWRRSTSQPHTHLPLPLREGPARAIVQSPLAVSSVLLRGGDGDRLFAIGSGEQLLQIGDLRQVVEHDIGVGGVVDEEVLVIG